MWTILAAIFSAAVKGLFAFFLPSKDEKLGKLEVTEVNQAQTIKELEVNEKVSDRVDSMPDADLASLSDRLNKRPGN